MEELGVKFVLSKDLTKITTEGPMAFAHLQDPESGESKVWMLRFCFLQLEESPLQ